MAIYDDGTTHSEIGKSYDFDGTTYYQHGKVYDYNGTTNSLIYTASFEVFNNGATSDYTGGWTERSSGNNAGSISTSIYTYGYNTAYSYKAYFTSAKIPTSQYNTLTIIWSPSATGTHSTWGCNRIGLSKTTTVGWVNGYPTANLVGGRYIESVSTVTNQTLTINISSLTTDYYFGIISCSGVDTYSGNWSKAYTYSIILT